MPEAACTLQRSILLSLSQRIGCSPCEHRRFFAKAVVTTQYVTVDLSFTYNALHCEIHYVALTISNTTKEKDISL